MGYEFAINRNVFMYNHLLMVSIDDMRYEAIVESSPCEEATLLIWLEDFQFPVDEMDTVKAKMTKWFEAQGITCIFNSGKGR